MRKASKGFCERVSEPSISLVFQIQEDSCVLKSADEMKSRAWSAHMVPKERTKKMPND